MPVPSQHIHTVRRGNVSSYFYSIRLYCPPAEKWKVGKMTIKIQYPQAQWKCDSPLSDVWNSSICSQQIFSSLSMKWLKTRLYRETSIRKSQKSHIFLWWILGKNQKPGLALSWSIMHVRFTSCNITCERRHLWGYKMMISLLAQNGKTLTYAHITENVISFGLFSVGIRVQHKGRFIWLCSPLW